MITLIILFVAVYAWRLFTWQDLMPLTWHDVVYMIDFTLSHMLYSIGIELFEDGSALIWNWSVCLIAFCR